MSGIDAQYVKIYLGVHIVRQAEHIGIDVHAVRDDEHRTQHYQSCSHDIEIPVLRLVVYKIRYQHGGNGEPKH